MDYFLLSVHLLMNQSFEWAFVGCFTWGLISILLSPCHLASIPLLMAYVSGQKRIPQWKDSIGYSFLFGIGLFSSIALIGFLCASAGRLLGDVPAFVMLVFGVMISFLGLDLAGVIQLPSTGGLTKLRPKGYLGALFLGAVYGIFSGACTFGFLAPVLASAALQENVFNGWLLVVIFGLGHCLPIVLAGCFISATCQFLQSSQLQKCLMYGRRLSGAIVFFIGCYFSILSLGVEFMN